MMKNMKKVCSLCMTIALVCTMLMPVFANDILEPSNVTSFNKIIQTILGVVQVIAFAFAIGMLLYLGIKYMMSSANEKADLKKGSINYLIGAIICFGAVGIVQMIKAFAIDNMHE